MNNITHTTKSTTKPIKVYRDNKLVVSRNLKNFSLYYFLRFSDWFDSKSHA